MINKVRDPFAIGMADKVSTAIRAVSTGFRRYGLLDFPHHSNIGDSAIWLGEVQMLRQLHGQGPAYVSNGRSSADEPERFVQDGILYLHGGGNLGDIWPAHQLYRESILARYPRNRIVLLPQSLHYRDPAAIERSKRAFGSHRDFHMMVRDQESLDFVRKHFDCPVMLVPDSAFGINMQTVARNTAPSGMTCLFRDDREQRDDAMAGRALFADARVEDWKVQSKGHLRISRLAMQIVRRSPQLPGKRALMALRTLAFNRMAHDLVASGFRQLDAAEVIVTDRLHGHIMASLLGKPHVVIDNSYGKISNFIRAWGASPMARSAADYVQARALADELLASTRQGKSGV